jgi:hypothetical protein
MAHIRDIVLRFAVGAALLLGIGLFIKFGSSAMELVVLR